MPRLSVAAVLGLVLLSQGGAQLVNSAPDENKAIRVSLVQLLATPERFEGSPVRVQGFLRIADEEQALYLTRDDAASVNLASSVWVETTESFSGYDKKFVVVEGVFTTKERGHLRLWPGAIRDISTMKEAMSRVPFEGR